MSVNHVLKVSDLRKAYGSGKRRVQANDGIDLQVAAGEVVGLFGHNGAGKTTLVNQIVGLVRPDSGRINLAGTDAVAHPDQARRLASVQAQANVPITGLTPRLAVELVGRIRGGGRKLVQARTQDLMESLDLMPWADTPAEKVSGGVARLAAFAMAVVVPGALVVLDEPTNDVDPVRRRLLWAQIRRLAEAGAGVLLVTHNVREAERAVDSLVILDHGVVVAADTPAALTASHAGTLILELDLAGARPTAWPSGIEPTRSDRLRVTAKVPLSRAAEVVQWAGEQVSRGLAEQYSLSPASLEDVYIDMVGPGAEREHELAKVN